VTTDFFTPVVDDAYTYGAIAAANALSDVYAMGGSPFLALNLAAFPVDLPMDTTNAIIRGGAEKAREAGVVVAGGHSIQDKEPKFGLVVIGFVDPRRYFTKGGAQLGDRLVLTKPLGFGVTTTALKRGIAADADVAEASEWMTRLNRSASEKALAANVCSVTDVTGYSLLGHAWEMASASGVGLRLVYKDLPFLKNAWRYAMQGAFAGGAADNRDYFSPHIRFAECMDETMQMLLFDPQTSGGLLMAVPQNELNSLLAAFQKSDEPVWVIGEVVEGDDIRVE